MDALAHPQASDGGDRRPAAGPPAANRPRPSSAAACGRRCRQQRRPERAELDAGGSLVMLVEHKIKALILGQQPLVEEAVIKVGTDRGIIILVRQADANRVIRLCWWQQVVGGLAKMPGAHGINPFPAGRKAWRR